MSDQEELKDAIGTDNQNSQISEEENQEQKCPETVMETLDSLQLKVNEWQDKYMRLFADFENYKKRMRQERFDLLQTAGSDLMLDILPVIDDFERGLNSLDAATDIEAVKQGYALIYNKLLNILKQKGLEPMETMHQEFNTDYHEAITMVESPELKGKVVDVVEKGYLIRGKVIRFAKVVVGN